MNPSGKVITQNCSACGDEFQTSALNRRKCYKCSPDRTRTGVAALSVVPRDSIDSAGTVLPVLSPAGEGTQPDLPHEPGRTESWVQDALEKLDADHTWRGALALALARDIDSSATTGSQRSTLSNQIEKIMTKIESLAPVQPDELDEVKAEIERKRAEAQ